MGFFDQAPRMDVRRGRRRPRAAWEQPDAAVPASLYIEPVFLARTDDVAVAASGWQAYPDGLSFTIEAHLREERSDQDLTDGWLHSPRGEAGEPLPDGLPRIGVRYADGRVARTLPTSPATPAKARGRC